MGDSRVARAGMITVGAVLALGLAGCQISGSASGSGGSQPSGSGSGDSGSGTSGSGAPGLSADAGGTSSGGTSSGGGSAAGGRCTGSDLRLSLGGGDAAAGTSYRRLVFANVSGHPCTVQGFPGVSYVGGDDGHQIGAPAVRTGSGGATIRLAAGQTASSNVGFVNVGNYDAAECRPTDTRGIRVYPPGETRSKFLALAGKGCANTKDQQLNVAALQRGSGQ